MPVTQADASGRMSTVFPVPSVTGAMKRLRTCDGCPIRKMSASRHHSDSRDWMPTRHACRCAVVVRVVADPGRNRLSQGRHCGRKVGGTGVLHRWASNPGVILAGAARAQRPPMAEACPHGPPPLGHRCSSSAQVEGARVPCIGDPSPTDGCAAPSAPRIARGVERSASWSCAPSRVGSSRTCRAALAVRTKRC